MLMKRLKILLITLWLIVFNATSFAADDEEAPSDKVPGYVSLGEPMVLNLATDSKRLTFLQLKADVLVKDDDAKKIVEAHISAIRHKLIVLLSEQSAIDMKTPAKREEIRQQATSEIRDMIDQMADNNNIEEILFSHFLVQ